MVCYNCFKEKSTYGPCSFCGYDPAGAEEKYPLALKAGSILNGRYTVGRVIGQGGFGITYIAQDYQTRERVAIKEYFPSELAGRSGTDSSIQVHSKDQKENFEYGKEQFLQEAKTLAAFIGDEHIVRIYSYFEENNTAYFVMEYVDGYALDKYMAQKGGRLSIDEANYLLLPLMPSLDKVHSKGIIHRDIAPDNIIVTKDGNAKLIDFGAARYSTGEKSKSLDVILKHGFAPAEQYMRRGRQGPYTDVYALAATYYYAVTGKMLPDAVERMQEDTMLMPSALGAKISPEQEETLLKALAVSYSDRYRSMHEFYRNMTEKEGAGAPSASDQLSAKKTKTENRTEKHTEPTKQGHIDTEKEEPHLEQKSFEREKRDNPQTYEKKKQETEEKKHQAAIDKHKEGQSEREKTKPSPRKKPIIVIIAAVLAVAVGLFLYSRSSGEKPMDESIPTATSEQKPEEAGITEQSNHIEQTEEVKTPEQTEQVEQNEQPVQPEQAEQSNQSEKNEQQTELAEQAGQDAQSKEEEPDVLTEQAEQVEQDVQPEQEKQDVQTEQIEQNAQTEQVKSPEDSYAEGLAHQAAGEWDAAIASFTEAGDYKDADEKIQEIQKEIRYQEASELLNAGNYREALLIFEELSASDSLPEIPQDSIPDPMAEQYAEAEYFLQEGDKAHAAMTFAALGTYRDAQERCHELWTHITQRNTIDAGKKHTIAISEDGSVLIAGGFDNNIGQLCRYTLDDWSDIVAVSSGIYHAVGLRDDGTVITVGQNMYGQCDVQNWDNIVAISAGFFHTVGLRSDGTVVATGYNGDGQCDVQNWKDVVAIATGGGYTLGLKADGTLLAVGYNNMSQCNVTDWKDLVSVCAGDQYTLGLKTDGSLFAIGANSEGQCDVHTWKDIISIGAGFVHSLGLKSDGSVVAAGSNYRGECSVSNWSNVVAFAAGESHSIGLLEDGTVVATGSNDFGQCNVSDWVNIKLPTNKATISLGKH